MTLHTQTMRKLQMLAKNVGDTDLSNSSQTQGTWQLCMTLPFGYPRISKTLKLSTQTPSNHCSSTAWCLCFFGLEKGYVRVENEGEDRYETYKTKAWGSITALYWRLLKSIPEQNSLGLHKNTTSNQYLTEEKSTYLYLLRTFTNIFTIESPPTRCVITCDSACLALIVRILNS